MFFLSSLQCIWKNKKIIIKNAYIANTTKIRIAFASYPNKKRIDVTVQQSIVFVSAICLIVSNIFQAPFFSYFIKGRLSQLTSVNDPLHSTLLVRGAVQAEYVPIIMATYNGLLIVKKIH